MAPSQLVQQLTDMIAMILNAELSFDQHSNPLSSPQFRAIAMCHSSLRQENDQLFLLLLRQKRWSSRSRLGIQRHGTAAAPCITPSKYTAGMTSNNASNFVQRELLSQQGDHPASPILQILRRTVRSHGAIPFKDAPIILHYLCGGQ